MISNSHNQVGEIMIIGNPSAT